MRCAITSILLCLYLGLFGQVTTYAKPQLNPKIDSLLREFINSNELAHSQQSLFIQKLDESKATYSANGDSLLIPVSILKVLTTSVALDLLGEEFRYHTLVKCDRLRIQNGILDDNLAIIGSGDPTLGSWRFESSPRKIADSIAKSIAGSGIRCIKGKIMLDASAFNGAPIPKRWKDYDYGNYYGAQANALNLHENVFSITFNPGMNIGDPTKIVACEPNLKQISVINEVKTGPKGSGDNVVVYSQPFDTAIICRGTVPLGENEFDVDASIPNPPQYFAQELKASFDRLKIRYDSVFEICYYPSSPLRDTILDFKSPPLKEIVYHTNLKSINVYAEALLKTIGMKQTGTGSYNTGIKELNKWMLSNGVEMPYIQYDGSGLCPDNRVSAKMMVHFLTLCRKKSWFPSLEKSLPVAGKSGSIANICKNCIAQGKVRAKSGFMKNVRSYAGYYENMKGEKFAFCFIVNNFATSPTAVKKKIEWLFVNLVKYS